MMKKLLALLLALLVLSGCSPADTPESSTPDAPAGSTTSGVTDTGAPTTGERVPDGTTTAGAPSGDTTGGTAQKTTGGKVTTGKITSSGTGGKPMVEQMTYDRSAASFRVWEFAGNADGFTAVGGGSKATAANSVLTFTADTGGYLASPAGLNIPAEAVRTVTFRLKTGGAKKLTLTWVRADGQSDKVSIDITADNQWHDYQIDLAGKDSWKDTVDALRFAVDAGKSVQLDWVRLTGLYLVPFPWIGGDFGQAAYRIKDIKSAFSSPNNAVTVGFSSLVQYMTDTDENGNYKGVSQRSVEYLVKLAKAVDAPVMIWLRNDPWAEPQSGQAEELYAEDKNLMWTEELTASPAYRHFETGYIYFCLAQTDLNGNKTEYWKQTEKLLAQCAKEVKQAILENPGYILGVTTTSEYRYLTKDERYILDYNPNTIKEFRDWAKKKYGTIDKFNATCGTKFTTWELRSTDYDPTTVENPGGFDAPREKYKPTAFWDVWGDFREYQITVAEQKLVDIIRQSLDECYIYTHQIAYDDYTTASPISTGNVNGANVGIDFFNHEVNSKNLNAIREMLGGDVTRTWGVPEWLVTHAASKETTRKALDAMLAANVKYLCPFNWGSKDMFDVEDSPSQEAIADYVKEMEALVKNPLSTASVKASKGFSGGTAIIDGLVKTGFETTAFSAGDWISFTLKKSRTLSQVTLIPMADGVFPTKVSVQVEKNGKLQTVGTYDLTGAAADKAVILRFAATDTATVKLVIDTPAKKDGKTVFALAEVTVG